MLPRTSSCPLGACWDYALWHGDYGDFARGYNGTVVDEDGGQGDGVESWHHAEDARTWWGTDTALLGGNGIPKPKWPIAACIAADSTTATTKMQESCI